MKTDQEQLAHMRHTLAHLLGATILRMYPGAKNTLGPAVDNGFYYDFDMSNITPRQGGSATLSDKDLPKIEKEMRKLLPTWTEFTHKEVSAEEAKEFFKDNPYKLELIEEIITKGEKITLYTAGMFTDLCRGGHSENPAKEIDPEAFKISHIAGAYWRGDSAKPMLTRVYGLAFKTKAELDAHLLQQEEAKKRDHKKLGKDMELFTFSPLVGSGLPLYMPKGTTIRNSILDFVSSLKKENDYKFVWTPHLAKENLYVTSGHLGKYDAMLPPITTEDGEKFVLKPMNCPHHFQIFNATPHSYRDLPLRLAENATDYRNEKSGELNGLLRVRSLTQDDTHHFVRHDQIPAEIDMILGITKTVYEIFGFNNFRARISVRDKKNKEKYFGTDDVWDSAEKALISAVERWGVPYFIGEGEAAFYGPKIDVMVKDTLGREWQLTTVQLDYVQPENFDMSYTDKEGKKARPAVLHAAILGSLDRFMAIIIEHFAGNFPLWLSPIQVRVLPVRDTHTAYAEEIFKKLRTAGIRAEIAREDIGLGKKVREAKEDRVSYLIIVGDKDIEAGSITLEHREKGAQGQFTAEKVLARFLEEINTKK